MSSKVREEMEIFVSIVRAERELELHRIREHGTTNPQHPIDCEVCKRVETEIDHLHRLIAMKTEEAVQ